MPVIGLSMSFPFMKNLNVSKKIFDIAWIFFGYQEKLLLQKILLDFGVACAIISKVLMLLMGFSAEKFQAMTITSQFLAFVHIFVDNSTYDLKSIFTWAAPFLNEPKPKLYFVFRELFQMIGLF